MALPPSAYRPFRDRFAQRRAQEAADRAREAREADERVEEGLDFLRGKLLAIGEANGLPVVR